MFRLAASQIAWEPGDEDKALGLLQAYGFSGVEAAPTRLVPTLPYNHPQAAGAFRDALAPRGLSVCSLQSIWYGLSGSLFGEERDFFLNYTQKAVLFAQAAGAKNLVFGCPRNRVKPPEADEQIAVDFFRALGDFALLHGAVLALEANPPEYGTNFMNSTAEALAMARETRSDGCMVNLDTSTMLINGEELSVIEGRVAELHHVHISEPFLAPLERHDLHRELAALLKHEGYTGYVSLEMKAASLPELERSLAYMAEVFR